MPKSLVMGDPLAKDDYRTNTADYKGAADISAGFNEADKTSKSGISGQTRKIKIRQAMQDKGVF